MSLLHFTLTVINVIRFNENTIKISFKQPSFKKIKYKAGQYLNLSVKIDGRKYNRAYSLSSSPSNDSTLDLTIKRVKNGIVSNYLNDHIKPGDILEVSGPFGDFTYNFEKNSEPLFLWGAGSGITPLYSILREVLTKNSETKIFLIYSNLNEESTIFKKELDELKNLYSKRFMVAYIYSKEINSRSEVYYLGRIKEAFILDFLKDKLIGLGNSVHYICGPRELKNTIKLNLEQLGVQTKDIFSEDFDLNINEEELVEVIQANVVIKIKDKTHTVLVEKGKSILDALLDNNIDILYSCQTGNCKECRARVLSGKTKMIGVEKSAELIKNETLLCCSFPISDHIQLKI